MVYFIHTYGGNAYGRPARVASWAGRVTDATPSMQTFVGKPVEELFSWLRDKNIDWEIIPGTDRQTVVGKMYTGKAEPKSN